VLSSEKSKRAVIEVFLFEQTSDPFGTDISSCSLLDFSGIRESKIEIRIDQALRRKHMAHNHGKEYQIKIVREDGIEELSGWMNTTEQVAQTMLAVHGLQGKTYWLLVRNIVCPDCSDKEQILMECPITNIPSPRYMPHDSGYLQVVESKDRYALDFSAPMHTR
jgi:hypothetical protein